jgi:hypothetical protein
MRLLLAGLAAVVPMLAYAQAPSAGPAAGGDVVKAVTQASVEADDVDVTQNITDQIDAYLEKSGLRARQKRHELEILQATSVVLVPITSRDWVTHRALAYEDALLQAEADYVKQQGLHIVDDTMQRLFKAAGEEPPPFDAGRVPGQEAELIRKIVAVANGRLDGELKNLNIDPKDYNSVPPPQRYVQLQNSLKRSTLRTAAAELVGLVPVQTFEGHDGKGNYTIGVVAVISQGMKDLAREVLTAHGEIAPDPSRAQDLTALYADPRQLIRDFGVRRVYDSAGLPVVVSFAQSASSYSGTDSAVAEEYRRAARANAEATADGNIAQFLKGSMNFTSNDGTVRELERAAERLPDSYVQQDAATKTATADMLTTLRTHADVTITGEQTLHTWSAKHPDNGQRIIGVIRMWSAAGEKATRELRDHRVPAVAASSAEQPHGAPAVATGRDLMNASDF